MTTPEPLPLPFVLSPDDLKDEEVSAVLDGAVVAAADTDVISVAGPGAVTCIQGLLTNDLDAVGDGGVVYGAVLTPKGMIISDMWAARDGAVVFLTVPRQGTDPLSEVFKRFLPPRLARPSMRSDELSVLRLVGPRALDVARLAGIALPQPGKAESAVVGEVACFVTRPTEAADFRLQIQLTKEHAARITSRLEDAGAVVSSSEALELSRILHGWPKLGAEIDDKTLPQEARYDEINGVSYTKGCYTGQETVARVHFRGHTNRALEGLVWDGTPSLEECEVIQEHKPMGRVSSIAWLSVLEQYIGLALIRREVNRDRELIAAGAPAEVVSIPFEINP
jgi:folate-binding protein YgfZ